MLTLIFEEQFHDHSYGFRLNRYGQQAALKALEMMNDGHSWIVDIDLAKFFGITDHDKLMTIFGRTVKDGDVITVLDSTLTHLPKHFGFTRKLANCMNPFSNSLFRYPKVCGGEKCNTGGYIE